VAHPLKALGQFFHPQQDSFSHAGYPAFQGHGLQGHGPDKTYNDVPKANLMARDTYDRLVKAASFMNTQLKRSTTPVQYDGFIQRRVEDFNGARTLSAKNTHLAKIIWYVTFRRRLQERPVQAGQGAIATRLTTQ
jgi:hypothetical protein